MSWIVVGVSAAGAVVGGISSASAQKASAKGADRARAQEIAGASSQYASSEASINMMKAVGREQTQNAILEALRAGEAKNQDVRDKVQEVTSSTIAKSEGLTSGRSAGREMIALQVKGNKALHDSKSDTSKMIIQLTDVQDKKTNELNSKLFNNYMEMATVLTTPGAVYQGSNLEVLSGAISGAATGASLGGAIKSSSRAGAAGGASSADNTLYSGGADWGTNGKF